MEGALSYRIRIELSALPEPLILRNPPLSPLFLLLPALRLLQLPRLYVLLYGGLHGPSGRLALRAGHYLLKSVGALLLRGKWIVYRLYVRLKLLLLLPLLR
jgi:hypothetical protein